jgi:hypothetical protein
MISSPCALHALGHVGRDELSARLAEAGFEKPRRVRIRRIPGQTLYEARKPGS